MLAYPCRLLQHIIRAHEKGSECRVADLKIRVSSVDLEYFECRFQAKDLEPFVKAMYRKLKPFVKVLTYKVLSSSKIASPGPIYLT